MRRVRVGERELGEGLTPFFVAELGICHEGSLAVALELTPFIEGLAEPRIVRGKRPAFAGGHLLIRIESKAARLGHRVHRADRAHRSPRTARSCSWWRWGITSTRCAVWGHPGRH